MKNKLSRKAMNISKSALTFLLAFVVMVVSVPFTGFAASTSASCNYYLIGQDFSNNLGQFISSNNTSRVDSPVDFEEHGKVLKREYYSSSGSAAGALLTHYDVLTEAYYLGDLEHVKVSFDIMFDGKVGTNSYFNMSTKDTTKMNYRVAGIEFKNDGTISVNSKYETTDNFAKYRNYELNTWYNYKMELNLKTDKISMWINDELICDDQNIAITIQNFGERITNNVMTYRLDMSGGADAGANVYFDNWNYYVPYSDFHNGDTVELTMKNTAAGSALTAKGLIVDNSQGVMLAANYKNNSLQSAEIVDAENIDGILTATFTQNIEKGNFYRFFLLDSIGNIRPLVPSIDYKSYSEADYQQIERRWKEFIVGPEDRGSSATINSRANSLVSTGKSAYNRFLSRKKTAEDAGKTLLDLPYLFDSGHDTHNIETVTLVNEYAKIYDMARACAVPNSSLTEDERADMVAAVKESLDWMYEKRYSHKASTSAVWKPHHTGSSWTGNWWDWFIGAPEYLLDSLMCIREEFTQEEIDHYLEFTKYLMSTYNNNLTNRDIVLERCYNDFGIGIITRDESMLFNIMNAYPILFRCVTYDSGFYEDGSFLYHLRHPYTGVYGSDALLDRMVTVMGIAEGSVFELPEYATDTYMFWALESFGPLMYQGGIMNMVRGRAVDSTNEAVDGAFIIASMLYMTDSVSEEDAYELKMFIKNQCVNESAKDYLYDNLDVYAAIKLDEILNDTSLPEPDPYVRSKVFYEMDRIVHQMPTWSAGLAMSSERVSNYEAINFQNPSGWYTGDGMLYVYTNRDQYNRQYFLYADPYKRPGTTEDNQLRESRNVSMEKGYFPEGAFVGGVNMDDLYSVGAMDFIAFHNETGSTTGHPEHNSDLVAKKSWFMFDDAIVCLGSGITQTSTGLDGDTNEYNVYTTVENRKVTSNALNIDGTDIAYSTSDTVSEGTVANAKWAHIDGVGGYFFPISSGTGYNTTLSYRQYKNSYNFFEMWFDHGVKPSNGKYAYAILPTMTKEQTEAYAQNPNFEILKNTSNYQVVRHNRLGITGYVFWEGGKSTEGIGTSAPVVLMKKESGNTVELAFSDPTQKLTGDLTITLTGTYSAFSADDEITVTKGSSSTTIKAVMDGSNGKTLKVRLQK